MSFTADTATAYEQGRTACLAEQPYRNPYVDRKGRVRSALAIAWRDGWESVYGRCYSDGSPIRS